MCSSDLGGGFSMILNYGLEQLVRAEGASKESMYGMFVGVATSIVLDALFILVLNLHVIGAGLSMVIANLTSTAYYIWFLENKSESLKGFLKHFKISLKDQFEIYKIGIAEVFKSVFMIVTTLLLNHFSVQYGDNVLASFGIAFVAGLIMLIPYLLKLNKGKLMENQTELAVAE